MVRRLFSREPPAQASNTHVHDSELQINSLKNFCAHALPLNVGTNSASAGGATARGLEAPADRAPIRAR